MNIVIYILNLDVITMVVFCNFNVCSLFLFVSTIFYNYSICPLFLSVNRQMLNCISCWFCVIVGVFGGEKD